MTCDHSSLGLATCPQCGKAVEVSAPVAIKRRPEWKQDDPRSQLVALLSAAEGEILGPSRKRGIRFLRQAQQILVGMPAGSWK